MMSFRRPAAFMFALALALSFGMQRASAAGPNSERITQLLNDAKTHALQAEEDAETLDSYTRSRVDWKSHSYELSSMKQHVNELGKIAAELQDLEPQGSDWQKKAVQQVIPLLKEMATNLTKTIEHLNANQARVRQSPYQQYTRTNYELASRTATLIHDLVDYEEAESAAQALKDKLELARN